MKGFSITETNLCFCIHNSALPDDWSGCPSKLQELNFQPNLIGDDINSTIDSIKADIGVLNNIPYDLTFEKNNTFIGSNEYYGSMLVDPSWNTEIRKEIRKYIANCLKAQYKNISSLKKRLCYSLEVKL